MGQDVDAREFSREDRTLYRAKVRRCLDVFARMLSERDFRVEHTHVGIEIEFNLVDDAGDPALKNVEALEAIADPTSRPSSACSTSRSTSRRPASRARVWTPVERRCATTSTPRRTRQPRSAPTW